MHLYELIINISSLWHAKAALLVVGRRAAKSRLVSWREAHCGRVVWVHCASHGEYEQVAPLLELIKKRQPEQLLVLSFYSPSGYETVKNDTVADHVTYLPADTRSSMRNFLATLDPSVCIMVKNEWWWQCLSLLLVKNVPVHLVSSTIRPQHYFIKYRLAMFSRVFHRLSSVGVVDKRSYHAMLQAYPDSAAYVSGDLRADRVQQIGTAAPLPKFLERFDIDGKIIVYGSVWLSDVEAMLQIMSRYDNCLHLLFPHDLSVDNVEKIAAAVDGTIVCAGTDVTSSHRLIIDRVGLLSKAYRLADISYVGGGYGAGIHNVLEPAIYRRPILTGPLMERSNEAVDLRRLGALHVIEAKTAWSDLCSDDYRQEVETVIAKYFKRHLGATEVTYNHIFGESQKI